MNSPIIQATDLAKCYPLYSSPQGRLKEWLLLGKKPFHRDFWALKGSTFSVPRGQSLGIVGRNGSGKSTLLKLICGVTRPTRGRLVVMGKVAALLELGAGFNPEFTGRDNARMMGALAGVASGEEEAYLAAVEKFAEIGPFLDQPVKNYSSGLFVRLAFAAAIHVNPDILVVDEALAVGDMYFHHKCYAKIREFKEQGMTLLFVSHDLAAIKSLCERALLLDEGVLLKDGPPDEVLDYYNGLIAQRETAARLEQRAVAEGVATRSGDGRAFLDAVELTGPDQGPVAALVSGQEVSVRCRLGFREPVDNPCVGILLRDRLGNDVFGVNTEGLTPIRGTFAPGDSLRVTFDFPVHLGPGTYSMSVAVHQGTTHLVQNHDWWDRAAVFRVLPRDQSIGAAWLPVRCRHERPTPVVGSQ